MNGDEAKKICCECGVSYPDEELHKYNNEDKYICNDCKSTCTHMYKKFDDCGKRLESFLNELKPANSLGNL